MSDEVFRFVMLFGRDHVLHTWDFILARDV